MFRPFKNEVVEGIVASVFRWGLLVDVGPIQVTVFHTQMPGHEYDDKKNVWRLDADEYSDQEQTIVRLRVQNMTEDGGKLNVVGSFDGDYLGKVQGGI